MILVHGNTLLNSSNACIEYFLNLVNVDRPRRVYYVNGTIPDRLFHYVSESGISSDERLMRSFNYERVDDLSSLHDYVSGIKSAEGDSGNGKVYIVIEGLQFIASNGLIQYTEKNALLSVIMIQLKKLEIDKNVSVFLLDEFNYFVLLSCKTVIRV